LTLSAEERAWLTVKCPYFKQAYLDYLSSYRFKPEQLTIKFIPDDEVSGTGHLEIVATGLWAETIMWEVPLMACLSATYFGIADTDWTYEGQEGKTDYLMLCSINFRTAPRPRSRKGKTTFGGPLYVQRIRYSTAALVQDAGYRCP
jgi:nicotinate phosphoribosyltransferase